PGARNDRSFLETLRSNLMKRALEFLHPLYGGTDGDGWEIGESLFVSGLFAVLQPIVGADGLIEVLAVEPETARAAAENTLIRSQIQPAVGLRLLDFEIICEAMDPAKHAFSVEYLN